MNDECLIRDLLSKEEDAVSSYVKAAAKSNNEHVKKVLLDIALEEKVHKGELITLLKTIGVTDHAEIKQGEEEAINKIMTDENYNVLEKIDARMSTSEIIKEIMDSWEKTGKIGNSEPNNKKDAMKQAVAIAYDTKRSVNEEFHPIKKEDGKWVLYGKHGQVLGKHDTEEDAKEQLRAVEVHMHG